MANGITTGSSEWHSVLAEVRRQTSKKAGGKDSDNIWYDLAEDASTSSDKPASPRWHQQHWAEAFDTLARTLSHHAHSRPFKAVTHSVFVVP